MKNSKMRLVKMLGLLGMLALCLLLAGCVVPPDDIGTNGNYVVTQNDLPFQSLNPVITATPYVPPANTATPAPAPSYSPVVQQVTPTPTVNTGAIGVTNNPLANVTPQIIISTSTATPASGSASSSTLKNGSTGDEVRKMQKRLKELGYLKGSADGDFGDATETAVKNFQANNGLTVDGKAGTATLNKLYSDSARKAATTTATNTPKPTSTPFTSLKNGSTGDEVRKMQQRLKTLGYLKGSADGDFGDATEQAVRDFQANNGLTVDGKAGTATLNKLYSDSARKAPTATATPKVTAKPTNTPKPTAKPTNTPKADDLDYYLQDGSSGARVKTLQNRLIELGWMTGSASGSYGHATEYAVRAFQKRYNNLWDDGIAGPDTLKALYSANAAKSNNAVSSLSMNLEYGDENDAVRAMQKRLKELGFYKNNTDGHFGDATKAAVIAFQKVNGLTADGKAPTATLSRIYSFDCKDASYLQDDEDAKKEEESSKPTATPGTNPQDNNVTVGGYTTLRRGDSGAAVKKLQQALKNNGFYSGSIDSQYSNAVFTAVKTFQKQYGLKVDGVAGPATQMLLYNDKASTAETNKTLKKGSTGTAVRNLQYVLYELGYYDGPISGEFGTMTADAVRAFQVNNDLSPVDGEAGPQTLKVIYSSKALGASATAASFDTLSKGDKGTAVVELQESLCALGYLSEITAEYDNATVEAVKNFQRRNGLNATGKADSATQSRLYSGNATAAW